MDKNTLTSVGKWAQSRVASGEEPPWTYNKLKELVQLTQDLADGMDSTAVFHVDDDKETSGQDSNVVQIDKFRQRSVTDDVPLPI